MKKIRLIKRHKIDESKWNQCVKKSINSKVYALSWYLDVVAFSWDGLIYGDYELVFPIVKKNFYFFKKLYVPLFCQQLGPFSPFPNLLINYKIINDLLVFLNNHYSLFEFSVNHYAANYYKECISKNYVKTQFFDRVNLELNLESSYQNIFSNYSKNTKRNLDTNLNASLYVNTIIDAKVFLNFFKKYINHKANLTIRDYSIVYNLIQVCMKKKIGFLYGVYDSQNNLLGCAFFIYFLKRHILLFNASNHKSNHSIMTYLIDNYIKDNCLKDEVLDFEGSNIEGVKRFYKGFGSLEKNYIYIKKNRYFF